MRWLEPPNGQWIGDIFDGAGCVEGFKRRGFGFAAQRVMLIGAGGAGSAIAFAVAHEKPKSMRLFDLDWDRVETLAAKLRGVDANMEVTIGKPTAEGVDILMNASPVGMLGDANTPFEASSIPKDVIVFDAIVKPEQTRLLALAEASGCQVVRGREMMRGQISRIVDFFSTVQHGGLIMKFVRYGLQGHELPGLIDAEGVIRSLSKYILDISPESIADGALERLRGIDPATLERVD